MTLLHANIEVTNKCPLRCKWCGDKRIREEGYMSYEDFCKIVDMLPVTEIRPFLSGEPFNNEKLIDMMEYALSRGHRIQNHSNGIPFVWYDARRLVELGQKYPNKIMLSFSIDDRLSQVQKDYVIPNVMSLIGLNHIYNNPLFIQIFSIVPYPKDHTVPSYIPIVGNVGYNVRWPHNFDVKESIPNSFKEEYKGPCEFLNDSIAIYYNGDVTVCCAELNGKRLIGNIFKDGYQPLIDKLHGFYELQKKGLPCEICKGCERYAQA